MKLLEIDARALYNWLLHGARVISGSNDSWQMVLLEYAPECLQLTTSNNSVQLQIKIPISGQYRDEVSFCLPLAQPKLYPNDKLGKWLDYVSGPVSLSWQPENNILTLSAAKNKMTLHCQPADEYPVYMHWETVTTTEISGENLITLVKRTIFAVADEGTNLARPGLEGIWLKHDLGCVISSDGNGMVLAGDYEADFDVVQDGLVIPKATWNLAKSIFGDCKTVTYQTNAQGVRFEAQTETERWRLVGQRLVFNYPNVISLVHTARTARIAAQTLTTGWVNAAAWYKGITAVLAFSASNKFGKIGLRPTNDTLWLSGVDQEVGATEIAVEAQFEGRMTPIFISGRYLQEGLKPLGDLPVKVEFGSDKQVLTFETTNGDYLYLAAPMVGA